MGRKGCFKLLGPGALDLVEAEFRIAAEDGECFAAGLGDEEAVEGVAVVPGEAGDLVAMGGLEIEAADAVALHFLRDEAGPIGAEAEVGAVEAEFDSDFPKRGDAPEQFVGGLEEGAGSFAKAGVVGHHPEEGLGVEEEFHADGSSGEGSATLLVLAGV